MDDVAKVWDFLAAHWAVWPWYLRLIFGLLVLGFLLWGLATLWTAMREAWWPSKSEPEGAAAGSTVGGAPVVPSSVMTDSGNKGGGGNTFNVTSTNQSGGQTAGIINNYAPIPRRIMGKGVGPPFAQSLSGRIVDRVSISAVGMDSETAQLADDFWHMAVQLKWDVTSRPNTALVPGVVRRGVVITSAAKAGDQQDPLRALRDWLVSEGIAAEYEPDSPQNMIWVWPQ